jgi:DNA-binding NarL/FixJ family response regulator
MTRRPRILLADDHRMFAEGLRSLLADEFELVGVVEDGAAATTAPPPAQPAAATPVGQVV